MTDDSQPEGKAGKLKGFFGTMQRRVGKTIERIRVEGATPRQRIVLDMTQIDRWPEKLLRASRVQERVHDHLKETARHMDAVREAKAALTDPRLKESRIPERAEAIFDEHLPLLLREVDALLDAARFPDDPFLIEKHHDRFRDALKRYQDSTAKSQTALQEYLGPELHGLGDRLHGLEDSAIGLSQSLEEGRLANIVAIKAAVEEHEATRAKEQKLIAMKRDAMDEVDRLEARKRKIKERIAYYSEQARNPRFKELISEEEELLRKLDELRATPRPPEQQEPLERPIAQRLAFLRKQMINDITAMNINEQRTFLEAAKDEILLRRRRLERIDELLGQLGSEAFKAKVMPLIEPFDAIIEEATAITGQEDE